MKTRQLTDQQYYLRYNHFHKMDLEKVGSFKVIKNWTKNCRCIIDVGCGVGHLTNYLKATGCDPNQYAIKCARQFYPQTKFHCGILQSLKLPNASVETIVCYNVLEHLTSTLRQSLFNEIKRVLKKDGLLIAGYIDENHWANKLRTLFDPSQAKGDQTHQVSWSLSDFRQAVKNGGFVIQEEKMASPFGKLIPLTKYLKGELLLKCRKKESGKPC